MAAKPCFSLHLCVVCCSEVHFGAQRFVNIINKEISIKYIIEVVEPSLYFSHFLSGIVKYFRKDISDIHSPTRTDFYWS